MSTAKLREKEKDRIYERKLLKEREVEDKEFGDKPKFMTAAYKKKLQEDQKWEYEDRQAFSKATILLACSWHAELTLSLAL